jgi:hypothetical protein
LVFDHFWFPTKLLDAPSPLVVVDDSSLNGEHGANPQNGRADGRLRALA